MNCGHGKNKRHPQLSRLIDDWLLWDKCTAPSCTMLCSKVVDKKYDLFFQALVKWCGVMKYKNPAAMCLNEWVSDDDNDDDAMRSINNVVITTYTVLNNGLKHKGRCGSLLFWINLIN